ncbi:unnamed protein product, partial [Cuscuta epithymum]
MFMCDDNKKSVVLTNCRNRWKGFKTRLTRDYFVTQKKNEVEHPPWNIYSGITEDDWEKFKQIRESDEFKELSEQNRTNQQENEHPHRMGRGGYGHADQEYMRAKIKEALLSAPSSSGAESATSTSTVATRPRYIKWIDGRTDKKGLIPNPKTRLVVNTIHDLVEKEKVGEFIPVGSHDILTEALGNSEHGGRVRGIAGKANLTSFFKRKKRRQNEIMVPLKQLQEYAKLVRDQTIVELEVKWEQRTYEILKSCGITPPCDVEFKTRDFTPPFPNSSSVHSFEPDPFVNTSKDELPCELKVPGNRVVAKGVLCKHL